jgi:hypothetical protein
MKYTEPALEALVARMDKLEAQNRRWKLAGILLGLSSLSLVLMAAKAADHTDPTVVHARTVEAQDFVLKDEDGQVRARLTLNPNKTRHGRDILNPTDPAYGSSALQFYDDKGEAFWTAPQAPLMLPAR